MTTSNLVNYYMQEYSLTKYQAEKEVVKIIVDKVNNNKVPIEKIVQYKGKLIVTINI